MFNKQKFDELILDSKVVGIKQEPFKLKSGRLSHWYANCRVLSDNFLLLDKVADSVIEFLKERGITYDYVYGVPAGATKLGVAINYKLGLKNSAQKIIIGREKPKEHGDPKDKYFIGPLEAGDRVVVIEDVTTTGGSVINQLKFLKEAKVNVVAVIALVNRLEKRDDGLGVAEYIKKEFDIPYQWLSDAKRLLPLVVKEGKLSEELIKKVQENVNEFAIEPMQLK